MNDRRKKLLDTAAPVVDVQLAELAVEALTMEEAAELARVGRTLLYDAINPEKAAEKGLPLLPSFRIGRLRRVRPDAFRGWLRALEARAA